MSASLSSPCHFPLGESSLSSHKRVDRRSFHPSHYTDRCLRETDVISAIGPVQLAHPQYSHSRPVVARLTSEERKSRSLSSQVASSYSPPLQHQARMKTCVVSRPTPTFSYVSYIHTPHLTREHLYSSMHSARVPVARAKIITLGSLSSMSMPLQLTYEPCFSSSLKLQSFRTWRFVIVCNAWQGFRSFFSTYCI